MRGEDTPQHSAATHPLHEPEPHSGGAEQRETCEQRVPLSQVCHVDAKHGGGQEDHQGEGGKDDAHSARVHALGLCVSRSRRQRQLRSQGGAVAARQCVWLVPSAESTPGRLHGRGAEQQALQRRSATN